MFNEIIKLFLRIHNITLEVNNEIDKFHSIVVSNHISELDPFILFLIFSENNMKYRFISDNRIKHIPFFGIIADHFNTIYIDRKKPDEALYELNKNIHLHDNICIFPEGTMYYKNMIEKSNEICEKINIKNFKNVLCPKISGFNCIRSIIKPTYITDITLEYIYPDNYPKDFIKNSDEPLTILFLMLFRPIKIICNIKNIKVDTSNNFIINVFRNKDNELNS